LKFWAHVVAHANANVDANVNVGGGQCWVNVELIAMMRQSKFN